LKAPIRYDRKVRYSDTDAQGHVFNVNYFRYFDDAITDYMEAAMGGDHAAAGYEIVLAHAECDFAASARLGEKLTTEVRVERLGRTSLTFVLTVTEGEAARPICRGKEVYVVVDPKTFAPMEVPPSLREAVARLEGWPAP